MHKLSTYCCSKQTLVNAVIVCCVWVLGLLIGFLVANSIDVKSLEWIYIAVVLPMSIVSLALHTLLLLAFSFVPCKNSVLLCVCFLKAVCLGFSVMLVYTAFGTSAWLIRTMLLFSDITVCMFIMLCILGFFVRDSRHCSLGLVAFCFTLLVFDYLYLSHFLCDLF